MSWLSAVPDVLACAGLFFVPGLLATYLGGLRGITAWATAPLVTVAVAAAVAVLGGWFGFRFGVWPVVAGTVVMAGVAAGLALLLRSRGVGRPPADPRGYSLAVVIGAAIAAVLGAVTFIRGVSRPDAISQTSDAVFHYNAIRYIEQTGKASPLTIGTLAQPGTKASFYPDAWHAMAALLAELTGASIPVAATVTCLVIAVLVWPLSCLLLARLLFGGTGGRAVAAVVITGMVSTLFGAVAWSLTGVWGILWPNALGLALAPAGVALGLSITRVADGDTFGGQRWLFGVAGAWAIGIAHPNSALSVALICLFPLLAAVGPYLAGQYRRHSLGTTLTVVVVAVVVVVGAVVATKLPLVRAVEAISQNAVPTQKPPQALVSALSDSTNGLAPELLLATFSIIGMVACLVWRQRRWLVCAELAIAALYVGSAASSSHLAKLVTGLWYDDSYRIAATLPIVAIPLATMGVLAAGEWLQQFFRAVSGATASRPVLAVALPVAIGTVVAAATAIQAVPANATTVGSQFSTSGDQTFLSPAKLQFLETVARLVPASAVVADDPFDGTAYLYSLSGTRVLFPQVVPSSDEDPSYLARNLVRLDTDPLACDLVRSYGVSYMITAPDDYLIQQEQVSHNRAGVRAEYGFYAGVTDPGRDSGFRLIASAAGGQLRLYKITICQPASSAGPVEAANRAGG